jgi:hypothetical protein
MQKILRNGSVLRYSAHNPPCIAHVQRRSVSRNTAIHRGLRRELSAAQREPNHRDNHPPWEKRDRPQLSRREGRDGNRLGEIKLLRTQRARGAGEKEDGEAPLGFIRYHGQPPSNTTASRRGHTPTCDFDGPVSIPYTTAASEFIFGYAPVYAALKSACRKLYKIYLHPRAAHRSERRSDGLPQTVDTIDKIRWLSEEAGIQIVDVDDSWLPVLDKMSIDRPHNVRESYSELSLRVTDD